MRPPAPPQQEQPPPSKKAPSLLSPQQNEKLLQLWKTHGRELVDVKPSSGTADEMASIIPPHTHGFVVRLHAFFRDFLRAAAVSSTDTPSTAASFVLPAGQSALKVYAQYALVKNRSTSIPRNSSANTSSAGGTTNEQPQQQQQPMTIRLTGTGRRVLALHHEDFLQEVNQYECQSRTIPEDFLRCESFGAFLYHRPREALLALSCSMALAMVTLAQQQQPQQQPQPPVDEAVLHRFLDSTQIIVRFVHLQPQLPMVDVKTGLVGKLLTIKGHVVKARPKRLQVATADFVCLSCRSIQTHSFVEGRYSVPTGCSSSGTNKCRGRTFTMQRPTVRYVDAQEIRLQEAPEENTIQAGRTPRQMEVVLQHDLVDSCRPGDTVLVAATVAAINTAVAAGQLGKRARETSTYKLYLQAHSVTTMSESNHGNSSNKRRAGGSKKSSSSQQQQQQQVIYTQQQLQSITQLCHADHRYFGLTERRAFPFDLLVRSICPAIIGHHEVKAGLLLCLLGGTPTSDRNNNNSNNNGSIRSNSHILIVGDPSMGKSQMLLAATQLAARSVYVGGNTSSTTGLTVTLTKEAGGESGIEAGAMVLADQGICAIDEFDKMAKNHQDGLLEAMEQQQVSIAKAGVVASLPARCSVIAAANPKHGSYNMDKTVSENLNMSKPILSRFDLVFILRDRADKDLDRMVSSNIMKLYRSHTCATNSTSNLQASSIDAMPTEESLAGERMPLSERLAWVTDFQKQPLPANLVRDYIAYAREYCKPRLTQEAAAVLKDYFMELRYPANGERKCDSVPITTRQLEALMRLCQARAKACLRDFVLREDALDVVELMSQSVEQVHSDEGGVVDKSRGGAGGQSNRKVKKAFANEIRRIVGPGAECTLDDLRRIAEKVNCGLNEFQGLIEDLRNGGLLIKKASGNYQVVQ